MRDEDKFPTVRFHKCRACGQVYTGSLTGENACPSCQTAYQPAEQPESRFTRQVDGGHVLVTIKGSVYKIQELEELRGFIQEVLGRDTLSIAFAFEGSSFLSSSTINLLVSTMQTLSALGRPTYIITHDPEVLESLQMMDLDRVMRIVPDLEKYQSELA